MTQSPAPVQSGTNGMAVASLVLGIVSFAGPGLLTGIPAVIIGIVALRKTTTDRGLSWAGIITGGIATLLTLLMIGLFATLMLIGIFSANGHPDTRYQPYGSDTGSLQGEPYDSSKL